MQIKNRQGEVIHELDDDSLVSANLSGADLSGADLSGANLSGANLYRADLSGADLYRANLSGADLSGADLSGADLSGADLSGAKYRDEKILKLLLMSNIDGSGRLIYVYICEKETYVRAGCFENTLEKFKERALSEGKLIYANAVPAFVEAVRKELK
jgi:uncharacterized protein YjbI with pentapeptide repeats